MNFLDFLNYINIFMNLSLHQTLLTFTFYFWWLSQLKPSSALLEAMKVVQTQ